MNPTLHDAVAAAFKRWVAGVDVRHTRAGARYRGQDVAFLLRRPLIDDGFTVAMLAEGVGFVRAGVYMTRAEVLDYLVEHLAGIDETLTASLGGKTTLPAMLDLLPEHDGPYLRPKAPRAPRRATALVSDEARAETLQIMEIIFGPGDDGEAPRSVIKSDEVFEIYSELVEDERLLLGRNTFFRVADESPVATRKRRNTGTYFVRND